MRLAAFLVGTLVWLPCHVWSKEPSNTRQSLSQLVDTASSGVVTIRCTLADGTSQGSGFFIDDQTIVTNAHVVKGALGVIVKTSAGREVPARSFLALDDQRDICLLHLDTPVESTRALQLKKETPRRGDSVLAIGSPQGLDQTVSEGIVSSIRTNSELTLIQITAPISPGSSGGPILDMDGQVIGIATFKLTNGESLNFAISSNEIVALKRLDPPQMIVDIPELSPRANLLNGNVWKNLPINTQKVLQKVDNYYLLLPDGTPVDAFGYFLTRDTELIRTNGGDQRAYFGNAKSNEQVIVTRRPPMVDFASSRHEWHLIDSDVNGPAVSVGAQIASDRKRFATVSGKTVVLQAREPFTSVTGCVLWANETVSVAGRTYPRFEVIPVSELRPSPESLADACFATRTPVHTYSWRRRTFQNRETQYGPGNPGFRQQFDVPVGPIQVTYEWSQLDHPVKPK